MKLGHLDLSIVPDGTFRLDGGAMFGVIPRSLWQRVAPPDEANRILLALNPLLVRTGDRNVLIDTGIGDKWNDKARKIYAIEKPETLVQSIESKGLTVDQIDTVVLTHLHFDHCGGSTRYDDTGRLVPTFPNATYYVPRGDWEVAMNPHERIRASYVDIDYMPLQEAGVLKFVEDAAEPVPGIRYHVTGGHARYHAVILLESAGRKAIYWGDIIPTANHLKLPYIMGYDLFPEETLEVKRRLLKTSLEEEWINIFEHDRQIPACTLAKDGDDYIVKEPLSC